MLSTYQRRVSILELHDNSYECSEVKRCFIFYPPLIFNTSVSSECDDIAVLADVSLMMSKSA